MTRPTKLLIGVSLAVAMLFGTASAALAVPALTLTPTKASVTYPHSTKLQLVSSDGAAFVPATVVIQYQPIGSSTWKKLRTISADRTAEGTVTVPVSSHILRGITGFRAVAGELQSDVTTVAVKARLSAPKAPKSIKAGRKITVKGFIWPRHAAGSHPVDVTFWKFEAGAWVEKGVVHPKIVGKTADGSKWRFTYHVGAFDKGTWRMQVSHEDMKHAASVSKYTRLRVR